MQRLALCVALLFASAHAFSHSKLDPEFEKVTCGSAIKLTHLSTGFKLHSHEIPYGTGSGQQSVTGFPDNNDPNSYFVVEGGLNAECLRGTPVKCGQEIRLRHSNTGRRLHSHPFRAPLSGEQEVSCFGDFNYSDSGDNWVLICPSNEEFWLREHTVRLKHKDTGLYLSSSPRFRYQNPIPGQQEVHARAADKDANWSAQEGVYIGDRDYYQE